MGALPSSVQALCSLLSSAKASLLETTPVNREFFDLWNAADCTKEQILPKSLQELYLWPEGGCCVLGELRSAFPTAPCSSQVQIPEPQHPGGSMILPLAGTKAVQQRWLLKFQVQEGLEAELACCACGGAASPLRARCISGRLWWGSSPRDCRLRAAGAGKFAWNAPGRCTAVK